VNEHNVQRGWPEIEMGIALHTGDVVVGNIGSTNRSKYGVVGSTVNLTARIESFSVGSQILVSPALIREAGSGLILGEEVEVHAKGMQAALLCRELLGHEEHPEPARGEEEESLTTLAEPLTLFCVRLTDKHLHEQMERAILVSLPYDRAVIETGGPLARYTNLRLRLEAKVDGEVPEIYAKVIRPIDESSNRYIIHFTSVSPMMQARFMRLCGKGP